MRVILGFCSVFGFGTGTSVACTGCGINVGGSGGSRAFDWAEDLEGTGGTVCDCLVAHYSQVLVFFQECLVFINWGVGNVWGYGKLDVNK